MIRLRSGNRHVAGGVPSGDFAHEEPDPSDALPQRDVPAGVDDVEAGSDDADRLAPGIEHAFMRRAVDADRQPGHDRDTRVGQFGAKTSSNVASVRSAVTRADDRDAPRLHRRRVAADIKDLGRTRVVGERRRIGRRRRGATR